MNRRDPSVDQTKGLELELSTKRTELTNPTTPIWTLPTETLTEIFNIAHRSNLYRRTSVPLLISHVCHRFREITAHTPLLWADICFGYGCIRSRELLELYLSRSHGYPLDIELCIIASRPFDPVTELLPILQRHVARWRRFSVISGDAYWSYGPMMEALRSLYAPRLEVLELSVEWDFDYEGGFSNGILSGGTPVLSSVRLMGISLATGYPSLTSVTHLTIGCVGEPVQMPYRVVQCALTTASSLVKLVIWEDMHICIGDDKIDEPISIPSLLSFEILCFGRAGRLLPRTLSLIAAPNLESLSLDMPGKDHIPSLTAAVKVYPISQRFPRLTNITLWLVKGSGKDIDDGLTDIYTAIPGVTDLRTAVGKSPATLRSLIASEGLVHLPKLQSICVRQLWDKQYLELICQVISSRRRAGCPVARLGVPVSFLQDTPGDRLRWIRDQVQLDALDAQV